MLLLNFLITGKVSPHLIIGQRHKGQTCLHWVHLILLPSPHCEHKMISVWVPPDDWTSCLSPEEVSLTPPGTVSTCQDLTAILSVLTFPPYLVPLLIFDTSLDNWTLPLTLLPSPSIVMYLITWGKQLFAKMCKENVKYTTFMMWEHLASPSDLFSFLGLNLW